MSNTPSLADLDVETAKQRLNEVRDLFGQPGWKWLMVELEHEARGVRYSLTQAPKDTVGFLQGRHEQIADLLSFEDQVDHYISMIESEGDEDDADV